MSGGFAAAWQAADLDDPKWVKHDDEWLIEWHVGMATLRMKPATASHYATKLLNIALQEPKR